MLSETTLIEQIAAHLNWPLLGSTLTLRLLVWTLSVMIPYQDGKSVFVDGMLPRAMSGPYICVFDELDFCRLMSAIFMQAALEGNGLNITEDGGH